MTKCIRLPFPAELSQTNWLLYLEGKSTKLYVQNESRARFFKSKHLTIISFSEPLKKLLNQEMNIRDVSLKSWLSEKKNVNNYEPLGHSMGIRLVILHLNHSQRSSTLRH